MIKKIKKYIKLKEKKNKNIDLCHILILETLLNKPYKWFNYSHFKDYLEIYQFSTTTKALSGNIKDSINNVRIHEKNLFWINKRPFKKDKRMHEFKISNRGLKDLLE